jgi:hypothetical protein
VPTKIFTAEPEPEPVSFSSSFWQEKRVIRSKNGKIIFFIDNQFDTKLRKTKIVPMVSF